MAKILIISSDQSLMNWLKKLLTDYTYKVRTSNQGSQAVNMIADEKPDLILMDWHLNDLDGQTVCHNIKEDFPSVALILLLESNSVSSITTKLSCGANDFITKPIDKNNLLARIQAKLAKPNDSSTVLKVADLSLDPLRFEVKRGGNNIKLTPHEFELLKFMMRHKGNVLSREVILQRVWSYDSEVQSRAVDVYMGYLRRKIDHNHKKKLIYTMRGFGYSIKE